MILLLFLNLNHLCSSSLGTHTRLTTRKFANLLIMDLRCQKFKMVEVSLIVD